MRSAVLKLVCVVLMLSGEDIAVAAGDSYPEGDRFEARAFYEGLKRRGLTDLLASHLAEHPPADDLEGLLLARDIKLAEHADPSRSASERAAAIREANGLLEALIAQRPTDQRARGWQLELGKSLLYVEADRYTSNILYRGGAAADGRALRPIMARAVGVLVSLGEQLSAEYDGLDHLSAAEYDRREGRGEIDRLEQDMAMVEYLTAWARFYRALSREASDRLFTADLRAVLEYLEDRSYLLDTPQSATHYQAQGLLLAGMADRRMGNYASSRRRLALAIDVVGGIADEGERKELEWVVLLARVELVRGLYGAGHFNAAREALQVFERQVERSGRFDFGDSLVVGLLERSVYRAQASRAEARGRRVEADRLRERAVEGLAELARRADSYRDEIYATLYAVVREEEAVESLSTFERCAVLAGALGEADVLTGQIAELLSEGASSRVAAVVAAEERRARVLNRVIAVGGPMMDPEYDISPELGAEAGFNLAVALHRRGRRLDAAERFMAVARAHGSFFRSGDAATYAVQLAWELYNDASLGARSEVQELYLGALTTVTESFPKSASARYWQFFLAQHLAQRDRLDDAADAYAGVSPDHQRYAEAMYLGAEARAGALKGFAAIYPERIREINRRATSAINGARDAEEQLRRSVAAAGEDSRRAELLKLAARAKVLTGEICVVPGVNRWERALETLADFEQRYADASDLIGRVLRVRMIALESSGRAEEASQLIPRYVANDPNGAVPTLQGLFDSLNEEIDRDWRAGREERALARASSAVAIAEGMYEVARGQGERFNRGAIYALRLQLVEALLEAGSYQRAGVLAEECLTEDAERRADGEARDSRAIVARAEAHYQLGEYAEALPLFNQFFRGTQPGEREWWKALLRDLQCRTELGADPGQIIQVIQQRKYLDRDMGGAELRRKFNALLTANERRAKERR